MLFQFPCTNKETCATNSLFICCNTESSHLPYSWAGFFLLPSWSWNLPIWRPSWTQFAANNRTGIIVRFFFLGSVVLIRLNVCVFILHYYQIHSQSIFHFPASHSLYYHKRPEPCVENLGLHQNIWTSTLVWHFLSLETLGRHCAHRGM